MKRLILLCAALMLSLSLFSASMYFTLNNIYTYDTNAFSNPLPQNAGASFLESAEYIKRHNIGLNFASDTYFSSKARTGLSVSATVLFPFHAATIKPEGDFGGDWEYVSKDSLMGQRPATFFAIGPVFRAAFEHIDIGLALRGSIGSYDRFESGIDVGIQAQPFANFLINDSSYLSFGLMYDAHVMKFIYDEEKIYEKNYLMLTTGAYVGVGVVVGER